MTIRRDRRPIRVPTRFRMLSTDEADATTDDRTAHPHIEQLPWEEFASLFPAHRTGEPPVARSQLGVMA